ncbi:MAG: preprotein translocase subunit SecY [Clostridia bacterium]|nr:preprotein translocase subunit SecY [Clostridia bacterium]
MFKTLASAFKNPDLRKKIIITLVLLIVYRVGCFLPVPGIEASVFATNVGSDVSLLTLLNAVSGSALSNGAFLALGVTPYINASIIVQLLSVGIPALERLSKQGEDGKEKINLITKIIAIVLAIAQGIGIVLGFGSECLSPIFGSNLLWLSGVFVVLVLVAGTCFTMWLGDRITEQGVGNGLSLIIFIGIIATAAQGIASSIASVFGGNTTSLWELIGFVVTAFIIFALIVFFDLAERRIKVQYAKQVKGRKMFGGQSTYIPLKVNAGGVMPIIFATAIITFPNLVMQLFGVTRDSGWFARFYYDYLGAGGWVYSILVALLILFFSYFYAQIQFNPTDVAQNIQQNGGFIPQVRPGKPTVEYLSRISKRITLFGAVFLAFIAIVPTIIFKIVAGGSAGLLNAFTATGMLIVVSVAIELDTQINAQLLMKRHKNLL